MINNKFNKTWISLYLISAILFLFVGLIMLLADSRYINASQYIITAIIFLYAIYLIKNKNKKVKLNNNPSLNLGFIFSVIGLSGSQGNLTIGMWALGVILFLSGLFKK